MASIRLIAAVPLLAVCLIGFSGCAGKKGVVKESTLASDATEEERKALALKLFKEGAELLFVDDQEALIKFDQAREVEPTFVAAHYNAGVALEALGQPTEALLRYDACLSHDKQQENCLDNWILIKAKLELFDEAEVRVEQYLLEFPEAPFAMVAAAKLAFMRKDYSRAERFARQAIERDAENVEALFIMARIFYERKQYPASKWVLKNAIEVAPSHGGLYLALGHTDMALGLLHDALDSYALAVKAQPTEEALESYGLLLLKRGRVAEALPVLKRLVEIRPDDARNRLHLGNAYLANKMFDEAKASYQLALEKNPEDLDVNFNLGLLFFDLKPKDLPEMDRLKTSKSYFETYLKKTGLSKERVLEVKEYLRLLNQKIEMEEYAAESAKDTVEETPEPEEEPKEEELKEQPQEQPPVEQKQAPKEEPSVKAEELDQEAPKAADEEKAPVVKEQEKDHAKKTKEHEETKEQPKKEEKKPEGPQGFDEEEDDFFDEL